MDAHYLHIALTLAHNAVGLSSPNPRVGCVLVRDSQIIGQGFTQAAGQAHAEVMAIRDAQSKNHDTTGATAYVTLEPCSHHGRTPPCVNALIRAQVARVVIACLDPNPQVSGRGVANLRNAGIVVDVLPTEHEIAQSAYELNIGFMTRMTHQRVFTRMKWAQSADGKTALPNGRSQWITGDAARMDGHRYRARADVLVTGIGTVLHDNPQLNVREVEIEHPPTKCVLDTWVRLPVNARLFDDGTPVILVCADADESHAMYGQLQSRIEVLQQQNSQLQVWRMPLDGVHERMNVHALWQKFYQQSYSEIHIEAGATVNGALLEAGLVDEIVMYLAPRIVGAGVPAALFDATTQLDKLATYDPHATDGWFWADAKSIDSDVRLTLRRQATV